MDILAAVSIPAMRVRYILRRVIDDGSYLAFQFPLCG